MEESTKPRVRINAKQTSKGEWYFDVTAETESVEKSIQLINKAIADAEKTFTLAGRTLAM